jgi:hypothetical protein
MKNRKHYYENQTNPVNTFKVPKIELRGKYTEFEINKAKFNYFFFGFIAGLVILFILSYV